MLRRVRERLGGHEVERRLDAVGESSDLLQVELDGERRAQGERLDRSAEAALGQDRRADAAGQLTELAEGVLQLPLGSLELRRGGDRVAFEERADQLEAERDRAELLLGAVVQIALDAAFDRVRGLRDASARRLQAGGAFLHGEPLPLQRVELPLGADVAERDDGTRPVIELDRRRRVGHRHERAITADEPVLPDAHRLSRPLRLEERTLLDRERRAIGAQVVDRLVARPAEQLADVVVPEHVQGRGIPVQDPAVRLDHV